MPRTMALLALWKTWFEPKPASMKTEPTSPLTVQGLESCSTFAYKKGNSPFRLEHQPQNLHRSEKKKKKRSLKVTKSLKRILKSIWNFSKMIYIPLTLNPSTSHVFFRFFSTSLGSAKKKQLFTTFDGLVRWDPIPESGTQSYQTSPENRFPVTASRGGRQLGDPWSCWRWKNGDMPGPDINFFASIFRIKILTSWHDQLNTYHHNSQRVVIMNSFFSCS